MVALRRFGFSLTELTFVSAIIAFLLGLLAPALAGARRAGQEALSQANLGILAQLQASYSNQYQDALINPFGPDLGKTHWHDMLIPGTPATPTPRYLTFADPTGRDTEFFGVLAATVLVHESAPTPAGALAQTAVSPLDAPVLERTRKSIAQMTESESANSGGGATGPAASDIAWLIDSSYYFSPTLWFKPSRYVPGYTITSANNIKWWARNRQDQVAWPAAKALAVERFDFTRRTRAAGSWRSPASAHEPGPPMFNNIEATTRLAALDGHAQSICMATLSTQIGTPTNPTQYFPAGLWSPSPTLLRQWNLQNDPLQAGNTHEPPSGPFLNFFWGTQAGIAGRDLR